MSLVTLQGRSEYPAPKILIKIEEEVVVALLDSGASRSFLRKGFEGKKKQSSMIQLRIADGSVVKPSFLQDLRVTVGNFEARHDFHILESLPEECVLGMDFQTLYEISIHPAQQHARIGQGNILPFIQADEQKFTLRAKDRVTVPARSQCFVAVTSEARSGSNYLVEGLCEAEDVRKVIVARSLHEGRPDHILLLNCMETDCLVAQGASLATCIQARQPPPLSNSVGDTKIEFQLGSKLTRNEKIRLLKLLEGYGASLFATPERPFGRTNAGTHRIETLPGKGPVTQRLRPTSPGEKQVVREEIDKMIKHGVIRPSSSAWASPIVLVKKKDGSVRFCIDFRRLNDITVKDVFPLPRTSDLLESFQGSKIFSTLDAAAGYWQVPLTEEAIPKSAFISSEGLFEFLVMPFGLCNAPATYQRIMNVLLAGLNGLSCLVYLDDIIVFSKNFEDHVKDLVEV